jgi:hypothetical protein
MDTATLKQILLDEMQKYTGEGLNDVATLPINEAARMYAVIDVAQSGTSVWWGQCWSRIWNRIGS